MRWRVLQTGTPCYGCSNPRSDHLRCVWWCLSSSHRRSAPYRFSVVGVARFRCPRHRSEQYFTSSHTVFHFLRHWNGRPQTTQTLVGRCSRCAISVRAPLSEHTSSPAPPSHFRTSDTSARPARADGLSSGSRSSPAHRNWSRRTRSGQRCPRVRVRRAGNRSTRARRRRSDSRGIG